MTICNMTIEGGGRAGMIAPDETTFEYVRGRPGAPEDFDAAVAALARAADRRRRRVRHRGRDRRLGALADGHLGHQPRHGHRGRRAVPDPARWTDPSTPRRPSGRSPTWRSSPGTPITEIALDRVFIGSCTNSRIEDLREAASMVDRPQGRRARSGRWSSRAPQQVKAQAEEEGLDEVFRGAGFEWRAAGCSMCLGMNPDILDRGRALRVDLEPELRGPAGQGRADPPGQPEDGGRGRDRGAVRRHQELEREA